MKNVSSYIGKTALAALIASTLFVVGCADQRGFDVKRLPPVPSVSEKGGPNGGASDGSDTSTVIPQDQDQMDSSALDLSGQDQPQKDVSGVDSDQSGKDQPHSDSESQGEQPEKPRKQSDEQAKQDLAQLVDTNVITYSEVEKLKEEHKNLVFSNEKAGSVQWIKFYGFAEEPIINKGISFNIRKEICKKLCVNCGTSNNIECDHKNDCWMFNDSRIGEKNKQKLSDFQPLCKHCNDIKRQVKAKMRKENKRQPPPPCILLAFGIKFTKGDETFNIKDPNWGIGSYWYDPVGFMKDVKHILTNSK